jgi:glycosyltransferase involved in cell wall biosynthesis
VAPTFDRVFVCSADDRTRLAAISPAAAIDVVPNGIDVDAFTPDDRIASDGSLAFVGTMDYHANVTGALHFVEHILPVVRRRHPRVITYIIGKSPTDEIRALASDTVRVTGAVPDVRPFLNRAAVSVVPLLVGGGTRLKILESMAMGKAIVSTSIGCEGIDARHGETIFLEDDPESFGARVSELLEHPAEAKRLGVRARAFVDAQFRWSSIVEIIASAYRACLARKTSVQDSTADAPR